MTWPCLVLCACLSADPVYDPQVDSPWNRLYDVLYTHRFSNGDVYWYDGALDPPWDTWSRFHRDEKFFGDVVSRLDAFQRLPPTQVERQPAVRRALLLRDLWPVFERQSNEYLIKDDAAASARQRDLSVRLAKVIRRLELSEDEVRRLPDTLMTAREQSFAPADYDPKSPEAGFVPFNLCDETGPWVVYANTSKSLAGRLHNMQTACAFFTLHISIGGERQAAIRFLETYKKSRGSTMVPAGTSLALLRRLVLPVSSGKLMVTSLVESLQIIVAEPEGDRRYKLVLDRAGFLAGRTGLRFVTSDEPLDFYGFGGRVFTTPKVDTDGEPIAPVARPANRDPAVPSSHLLNQCVICHNTTVGNRLFANCDSGTAVPSTIEDQLKLLLKSKQEFKGWKLYQELRE